MLKKKRKQEPATAAYKEKKCRNATDWNEAPYINTSSVFKLLSPLTLCAMFDHIQNYKAYFNFFIDKTNHNKNIWYLKK
jgi:hypothetical protein